ncbi:unnamed protein product, partial [marine sediment metagenome]
TAGIISGIAKAQVSWMVRTEGQGRTKGETLAGEWKMSILFFHAKKGRIICSYNTRIAKGLTGILQIIS